ncbi:MAG: hypothetical protein RL014_2897 [Pseudomonadota bacterium]|jgi:hypothetical protein
MRVCIEGCALLNNEEFEREMIRLARERGGDYGRDALKHCASALRNQTISPALMHFLAERLEQVEAAQAQADEIRSSGTRTPGWILENMQAAIREALCIDRPVGKPPDPFPAWELPLAALAAILARAGWRAEAINSKMDEVRRDLDGKDQGLDRRTAQSIRKKYKPMLNLDTEILEHLAGEQMRDILRKLLPQP